MQSIKTPWFRLYSELINDLKIKSIAYTTKQPKATVIGAWVGILSLASNSPKRGYLLKSENICIEDFQIAMEIGVDPELFDVLMRAFEENDMLEKDGCWRIKNWDKRQFESDNSSARVAAFRKRQAEMLPENDDSQELAGEKSRKSDETLQERLSNVIDSDSDSDSDTDTEKEEEVPNGTLSANADYQAVRKRYVELFPDKPKPRSNNKTLSGKAKTRMKLKHFREDWESALERASGSQFLLNSSWFHLGWFLKNDDNWEKCLNGNYDDKGRPPHGQNGNGNHALRGAKVSKVAGEF